MPVVRGGSRRFHPYIGGNAVDQQAIVENEDSALIDFSEQLLLVKRLDESLPVLLMDEAVGVLPAFGEEIRPAPLRRPLSFLHPGAVFDIIPRFNVHIVQVKIVLNQRVDHVFVYRARGYCVLIGSLGPVALFPDLLQLGDVHAHAEQAQPSGGIVEYHFCCPELTWIPHRVNNIFKEYVWRIYQERFFVILRKMPGRVRIEYVKIRQPDGLRGRSFMRVFREPLIAVKIGPGLSVLGEAQGGHVVQQGVQRFLPEHQLFGQVIQLRDIAFQIGGDAAEGARQYPDLVVLVVVELMIVMTLADLFRNLREILQGLCDPSRKPHDEGDERRQQRDKDDDDHDDPFLPACVDFIHGYGYVQAIAVAQRKGDRELVNALKIIPDDSLVADQCRRHLQRRFHGYGIYPRMIDELPVGVVHKRVSVFIQRDVVYLFGHEGIVHFNADDAHELPVQIDRRVVGDDPHVQIVGDIRRQPDRLARRFGHGKPHKLRGIACIILRNIGYLMFLKSFPVRIDKPEALNAC